MKKIILATVLAMGAFLPASVSAQEDTKEYNMVITLQNGTTITLGHNDIKNITFNGEEISISGNVINTIEECFMQIEQVNEHLTQILNGIEADYATKAELEEAYMQIEEANKTMSQILNGVAEDYATKGELEEAFLQIEKSNETMTQILNGVAEDYATKADLQVAFAQIEEVNVVMTQMLNGFKDDYVSKEEGEEIWNAIQGENGLKEQMTQFYHAGQNALEEAKDEVFSIMKDYMNMLQEQIEILNAKVSELEAK